MPDWLRAACGYFLWGMVVTAILVGGKMWFERTSWGGYLEEYTYDFFQRRLGEERGLESLSAVIIDISDVPPVTPRAGAAYTDRNVLTQLLTQLVSPDARPKAIGIDVDFSPDVSGPVAPKDAETFKQWLQLSQDRKVPIFLGVGRGAAGPPAGWLGSIEWAPLAAAIVVPHDPKKLPLFFFPETKMLTDPTTRLPSLATRLAEAYDAKLFESRGFDRPGPAEEEHGFSWLEDVTSRRLPGGNVTEFMIDYSAMPQLEMTKIAVNSGQLPSDYVRRVRDRMVLIGAAEWRDAAAHPASDVFAVPGSIAQVAGVYVHASGAMSLLTEPLRTFSHAGRIAVDFVLAILCVGCVAVALAVSRGQVHQHMLGSWLAVLVAVVVVVIAVLLVAIFRLVWMDWIPLALATLLHPWLHPRLQHAPSAGKKLIKRLWHTFEVPR